MQTYNLLKKIVPELIDVFDKRYNILRTIRLLQPIGRRSLASKLDLSERAVRTETIFLSEAGLLDVNASGMFITEKGEALLSDLREFAFYINSVNSLEEKLCSILGLEKAYVVPGNVDEEKDILREIGITVADILKKIIKDSSIIAVTGGSTVAEVARALSTSKDNSDVIVIPARGGMGLNVEYQSNIIASIFAKKLGGQYKMLHVPDRIKPEALESLLNDPEIRTVVNMLGDSNILIYGIGRAFDMAVRRKLTDVQRERLEETSAVAEAFGYFFNKKGEIVLTSECSWLTLDNLQSIPTTIGVAGGTLKAEAIIAVMSYIDGGVLVTDEGAAREIIKLSH